MATQFIGNLKTIMKNWFYDKDEIESRLSTKASTSQTQNLDTRLTTLENYSTTTEAEWNENNGILTIINNPYKEEPEEEE